MGNESGRKAEGPTNEPLRVLLVEDNPGDIALLREMLGSSSATQFDIHSAVRLQEAIAWIQKESPDVVLLDLGLPDSSGLATLQAINDQHFKTPIVVLTGLTDESLGMQAVSIGAQDYLVKGHVDSGSMERSIRYAVQRHKMMEELRESNDRYVSMFHENHAVMMLIDPITAQIMDVNHAAVDFYGYDRTTFLGMKISDLSNLPMEKVLESMDRATSGEQGHFFFQHFLANGQPSEVEIYSGPIHIKGMTYLYSIIHDITERKRAEAERAQLSKEVEEQRGLLQTVIDNAPAGIVVVSGTEATVRWVNDAYIALTGHTALSEDVRGKRLEEFVPKANANHVLELVRGVILTGNPVTEAEVEVEGPHGRRPTFWHFSAVPMAMKDQEKGVLVMFVNVTEQVSARHRIEEMAAKGDAERRRVRTILDNLPVGVTVADHTGRTIEKNDIVDTIWGGRTPLLGSIGDYKELKGWWADTGMSVRPDEWPLSRAIRKGETVVGEVVDILRLDGTRGTILSSAATIRDADGKVLGGVGVIQDITRQRRLEHDAIEAKEQAELYIDLLSHDISNMNAAVSGYLQTALEKMDIEQKNMQYFTKPQEILENSNRLIENVRKIQQVESHESKHGLVDLGWLLEDVRAEYEHYPGREVKITYKTAIKKFVLASDLLKDVFTNLISNSIKHSTGKVEISIMLNKIFDGGREYYKVSIEDDGPGIPDELKSRLFQRKQRGRTKTTGTGLGLYLVKKLVEDINGRVWVEDRMSGDPGQGARFVVMLPAVTNEAKSMV